MKFEKRGLTFVIVSLGMILFIFLVSAIPQIIVNSPSSSPFTTTNTSVELNFSISESNLGSLIYNWNGTNYTMYNGSLVLMYNFDTTQESIKAVFSSLTSYLYQDLTSVSNYVIQSGDVLEYDVMWTASGDKIAFDYTNSDTSSLRGNANDQNGLSTHPETDLSAYALNKWYHRVISLPVSHVGKTITYYDVVSEKDSGSATGYLKNIIITNGAGTTRKIIYTNGTPTSAEHLDGGAGTATLTNTSVVVEDVARNPINGIISGASWNSSGKYSGGYNFDGVDDFIQTGAIATTNLHNWTLSAWVKPATMPSNTDTASFVLFNGYGDNSGYGMGILNGSNNLTILYGGMAWYHSNYTVQNNTWTHLTVVNDRTNLYYYANGNLVSTQLSTANPSAPANNVIIGKQVSTVKRNFNGSIDEARIWNRSLSSNEVYQQYASNLQKLNSTQWYLYINQSKNATSSLDYGTYTYQLFATNSSGSLNSTDLRIIVIDSTSSNCVNLSDASTYQGKVAAGSGFYNVVQNITLCAGTYNTTQNMLRMQANNILIDCNNAILQGSNTFESVGIDVSSKQNITIQNCTINNFHSGIKLSSATGSIIKNNALFNSSYIGLYVASSNNISIINNNVSRNLIGIYFISATGTNMTGNRIAGSGQNGLIAKGRFSSNLIYDNYFNSFANLKFDASEENIWNITKVAGTNIVNGSYMAGNYWTNPTATGFSDSCADANSDGICDTSYTIKNKNTDYAPLAPRDNSPPNVTIFTASNATFINGNLTIQAIASDNIAVTNVLFQYKNSTLNYTTLCNVTATDSGTTNIYSCLWSTRSFSNSSSGYDFIAIAFDASGSNGTSIAHYTIDRSIPYAKDLSVVYPSGQYYIRNGQSILLRINVSDASEDGISSGINNSVVDLTLLNGAGNTTMTFALGSRSTAQWSWWNFSVEVNASTGQLSIPIYVRDNTLPNNIRGSDRFMVQVDNNLPTYDSLSDTAPVYNNKEVTFSLNAYDNYLLAGYIFSSNISGSWVNDSEVVLTGAAASFGVTKTVTTGNYSYRFFIRDNAGNINQTIINNFQVLGNPPVFSVALLNPNDTEVINNSNAQFYFAYYNGTAANCTLIIDDVENLSLSSPSSSTTLNLNQTLSEGSHSWSVGCYDNDQNQQVLSETRTISVDLAHPQISITYPTAIIYNHTVSVINYTYSDTNIYGCWYSLNNGVTNSSLSDCNNFTGLSSSEGSNTWKVYIKDIANNINSSSVSFIQDTVTPIFTNLQNQTVTYGIAFNFILTATDASSNVSCFSVNDTINFNVNCSGYLRNNNLLGSGLYWLNITVNDSVNNRNYGLMFVNVTPSTHSPETIAETPISSGGGRNYLLEQNTKTEELNIRTWISPNKTITTKIKQDKGTGIKEIELKSKNWLSGEIFVVAYNETPDFCSIEYQDEHKVYKVLDFNHTIKDESIDSGRLKIGIQKDWIYGNNISEIKFVRCYPQYEEVKSSYESETSSEGIYNVYINGFSAYAILGTLALGNSSEDGEKNWNAESKPYNLGKIFLWILFGIILIGLIILLIKHRIYLREKIHSKFFDFEFKFRIGK